MDINKRKPKVLFIMHMPPPVHGVSIMGKTIFDSKLINEGFECKYINESMSESVDEVGKSGFTKLRKLFCHIRHIRKTIKDFNPDLVYITPSGTNPCLSIFIRYAFEFSMLNKANCYKLIHFHDKGEKEKTEKWWARWYYRVMFRNSDVIFLSNLLVSQYQYYLIKEQIHICPNGIQPALQEEPSAERENSVPHILFLSNMMEEKGVYVLLDAISELNKKGIQLQCDFVGGWKDITPNDFEKYTELRGITNVVKAHGPVYGDKKQPFFKNADIFVFPSLQDTFGLVNLEAMENKLPVISTNVGGIPDVVKDGVNGFVCKTNDPIDLADKIEILISNKMLRIKLGEQGYKIFQEKFTISSFEKCMYGIIKNVLNKII